MAKWYKQYTNEHLNADFRNAFSNSNHDNSDSKSKVSDEDWDFILANGMLKILKEKIAENLDLNKAIVEKGKYLGTYRLDKSMFEELLKCKDWKLINRILNKLDKAGCGIDITENNNIIELQCKPILDELDNYTTKKLKELVKAGKVDVSLLDQQPTDTLGLDKKTGEVLTGEEIKSYPHKDLNLNDSDNNLTDEETSTEVLMENRKMILQSIGKSDDEIHEHMLKEFPDDYVPF